MKDGKHHFSCLASLLLSDWFYREVQSYRVGQSLYDDGLYMSDHRPVFADVCISSQ